jgi:tetratricopeptide (TPR) repeat protein
MTKQEAAETKLKAKASALKALELDNTLAEPHAVLAGEKLDQWDFAGAENEYKRAIELNSNYATAYQWYSELLAGLGRHEEAIAEIKKAYELDPFSVPVNVNVGMRYAQARRLDEAIVQLEKTLKLNPDYPVANSMLSSIYFHKGRYEESLALSAKALILTKEETVESAERRTNELRKALKSEGTKGYWRKILEEDLELYQKGIGSAVWIAGDYAFLGEKEKTFEWLEKAYTERDRGLTYLKTDRAFDNLHSDPRFKDLLQRIGLPL